MTVPSPETDCNPNDVPQTADVCAVIQRAAFDPEITDASLGVLVRLLMDSPFGDGPAGIILGLTYRGYLICEARPRADAP